MSRHYARPTFEVFFERRRAEIFLVKPNPEG